MNTSLNDRLARIVALCTILIFAVVLHATDDLPILDLAQVSEIEYLKPYLSYYSPKKEGKEIDRLASKGDELFTPLQGNQLSFWKERAWFKFTLRNDDPLKEYSLISRLGGYCNNHILHYQNSSGDWVRQYFNVSTPITNREVPIDQAAFVLPSFTGTKTFYIHTDVKLWLTAEWILCNSQGLSYFIKTKSNYTVFYLIVMVLVLGFSIVGGLLFNAKLPYYFAFYVFCTGTYILLESGWISETLFHHQPTWTYNLSLIIFGAFLASFLLYTRAIFRLGKIPSIIKKIFDWMIVVTVLFTMAKLIFNDIRMIDFLIDILGYVAILAFMTAAIYAVKTNIPMRWLLAGTLIMIIGFSIVDLHIRGIIYFPSAIQWSMFSLVAEIVIVGIGTFIAAKLEVGNLMLAKTQNEKLKGDIVRLKQEVDQSLSAYETLVNRSGKGKLNVPPNYLDNPLSARELQILQLLARKQNNREIATHLHLSRNTIKVHLKKIYRKLGTHSREEAVEISKMYGLI